MAVNHGVTLLNSQDIRMLMDNFSSFWCHIWATYRERQWSYPRASPL